MSPKTRYLQGLNPKQREAARATEGPVLVLAGAGSGKTQVITRRIAHIVANGLATPDEILAVTFTNKAAAEMRERVGGLIGTSEAKKVMLSTFHSYCLKILRTHCERIGIRKNFSIAGESDSRTLLRRVVDDMNSQTMSYSPGMFQSTISLCKNTNVLPDEGGTMPLASDTDAKYGEQLPDVYTKYQSALRAANSLDFDDLLLMTLKLWRACPDVLALCRGKFKYVMVDEYQDTNALQFELIRLLVEAHRNFCVVGDDDQSIYAWRGADPRNILEFEKSFPEAKIVTLDQNYRSTETILKAANSVIKNNGSRREKQLWSELGVGRPIDWITVSDEDAEAKEAVKWLKYIQQKTGARYSDFAMLYRSNIQSRPLEVILRQAGIPYVVVGGQDFFERSEVKDIISYLKVIANPRDEAAFLRVVNMPRRGIGDNTLHRAHDICREEGASLGMALSEVLKRGKAPKRAEQGIQEFLSVMQQFRKQFSEGKSSLKTMVEDLILKIDYRGELERTCKNPGQAQARWNNVEVVVNAIGEYEEKAENKGKVLQNFLDDSHLNSDKNFSKEDRRKTGVTLMTIHSAKGLEFPFVFIMGCEDGLMPHDKSVKENGLDEERRLFYVALTRGKRHVTLFDALTRVRGGREKECQPSRFLKELPPELVKRHIRAARGGMVATAPGDDDVAMTKAMVQAKRKARSRR